MLSHCRNVLSCYHLYTNYNTYRLVVIAIEIVIVTSIIAMICAYLLPTERFWLAVDSNPVWVEFRWRHSGVSDHV